MEHYDHKRLLVLGSWLEEFLNPNIKNSDYLKIAENALKILNARFHIAENEATIHMIEFITSTDQWKKVRKFKNIHYDDVRLWELLDEIDWDDISSYLSYRMKLIDQSDLFDDNGNADFWVEANLINIWDLFLLKFFFLHSFFKKVMDLKKPWTQVIENYQNYHDDGDYYFYKFDDYSDSAFENLIDKYKYLSETINFSKGKIEKYNTFNFWKPYSENISFFPWLTILSHILFEFLELGGENFFIFCKHCNRLSIGKRKGRKNYCSDKCRYQANSQMNKR